MPINETILQVSSSISNLWNAIQLLVGGVFGLYIILLILRIYGNKRIKTILKEVKELRKDINYLKRKGKKKRK